MFSMLRTRLLATRYNAISIPASHWILALPILLAIAALSIRQIDSYPPTPDEFYSMNNAGWLINRPYSPSDVLNSLIENSPNHTPGYFLLLNQWGAYVGYDLALGRVFSIFASLLSLAMTYRIGRDFVAPVAGLFATILLASNAFYSLYLAHVRMYPLLVFFAALVLWLYLRIVQRRKAVKFRDYFALFASSYALVNIHVFSGLFFVSLGIYHLFAVAKTKRWLYVSLAFIIAFLLFSPWLHILINFGIDLTFEHWGRDTTSTWQILIAWLMTSNNGALLLLLVSLAALAVGHGHRDGELKLKSQNIIVWIFLLVLGLVAELSDSFRTNSMRLMLTGLPPLVLTLSATLYLLFRVRKYPGLLVLLSYTLAGVQRNHSVKWTKYASADASRFESLPWQAVSRIATRVDHGVAIIGYQLDDTVLRWKSYIGFSQEEYYFGRHGLEIFSVTNTQQFHNYVRLLAITDPAIRIFYNASLINSAEQSQFIDILDDAGYELCEDLTIGIDTAVRFFGWNSLDCQVPQFVSNNQTSIMDYDFFSAKLDGKTLYFFDRFTMQSSIDASEYRMSYQLISESWTNEAQVDLDLVHEGELRRFSMDVANVPLGSYRLMLILYDKTTRERQPWYDNPGYVPEMLELAKITIDESTQPEA